MKTALIHDWLLGYSGSERVLAAMAEIYPKAPIYTLIHNPDGMAGSPLEGKDIRTSFLQRLPGAKKHHRRFLPLMPLAIEQFDLSEYDLVISSSHAVAKGVLTGADQLHLSYVHTPVRYGWDLYHRYMREHGLERGVRSLPAKAILHYLRNWDVASANRVDAFVANSNYIARRIEKTYRREAKVIYPPVDVQRFSADQPREDFYLSVCRFVPYKHVDIIVEAFAQNGKKLVVIGEGPQRQNLVEMAKGCNNITFSSNQNDGQVTDYMQRCKAFIMASDEDFGITPVEAQAAGAPVIAYGKGGALETVVDGKTGCFFDEQTAASLNGAVDKLEQMQSIFSPVDIASHAQKFSKSRFKEEFSAFVNQFL